MKRNNLDRGLSQRGTHPKDGSGTKLVESGLSPVVNLLVCLTVSVLLFNSKAESGVEINGTWHEKTETRERFCLNGEWDLYPIPGDKNHHWYAPPDLKDADGAERTMKMRVPGTWKGGAWWAEAQFFNDADVSYLTQCLRAWYKRSFFVPSEWAGRQVTLEFGGVGYKAVVYINRQMVATHIGGFTPFEIDITRQVKPGEVNEVLVYNASFGRHWERPQEGPLVAEGNFSGIWGDVFLRATSNIFIDNVFVKTSVRAGKLTCVTEIINKDSKDRTVSVENEVMDGDKTVLSIPGKQVTVPAGGMVKVEVEKEWQNPRYWSLEDPHLYFLKTMIRESGNAVDETSTRFGFREFWIDGKDFRLNGEIVRLRNFPIVGQRLADERPEYVRGWLKLMKEKLYHNCIRMQHINSGIYPEIADEVGMLIEEGTGFVGGDEKARWNWPEANVQTRNEITEWVRARRNHPSIVIWSTENECWSMVDVKRYRDGDREAIGIYKWLLGVGDWIREHDSTRPVTYHHNGSMHDWTKSYLEEEFEAGDLMGKVDNYNLHYPKHYRFIAEQVELGDYWAREKKKPLIVGEFPGPEVGTPGNTADFKIQGEESVLHGTIEANAGYYYFRRLVGAWRSVGVSGLYGWMPNLFAVRKVMDRHEFSWDDLTTPYPKPLMVRYSCYNPGWDKTKPEYVPDNATPEANNRFWDLLADSFSPLLINLGGAYWEHNELSGAKLTKTASIVNDTPAGQEVIWSWALEESGKRLAGGTETVQLARAEIRKVSFSMELPEVTKVTELQLRLTATAGDIVSKDALEITVYPLESILAPKFPMVKIALYDKTGKTSRVLKEAGLAFTAIEDIPLGLKSSKYDLLIIGCQSADETLASSGEKSSTVRDIQEFVNSGGRVLVFEQERETYNNLDLIFPGIRTPPIEHGSPSHWACSYAAVAAPGHPVFNGLKKGISLWKGEYGRIVEFHYPRPFGTSAWPLLFSAKYSTPLIEGVYGNGRYLLCQVTLTTRYGKDPEATILMNNLLSYILSSPPVREARAGTVGDVGKLLGRFVADDLTNRLTEADITKSDVLILGRESMIAGSEVTQNTQKILEFVKGGGTVFALPQNPATFKVDWLPGHVGLREMKSQWIFKEDTQSPLLWGVSAFDLTRFYSYHHGSGLINEWSLPKVEAELCDWSPEWSSLLLVSKEPGNWDVCSDEPVGGVYPTGGSALLHARYGNGKIILCQLDLGRNCAAVPEEALEDLEMPKLSPRIVADTLLANLGLKATAEAQKGPTPGQFRWAMQKVADNGKAYPSAWKIIGPFENPGNENFRVTQGPQQDILFGKTPAQSYPGVAGEQVSWKVVPPDKSRQGFINLDELFKRPDYVTAYAMMTIKSPKARKAVFFIGSDDGYRLWLNGELVGQFDIARGSAPMTEIHRVDLREGENVVMLKISEHVGDYNFYFSMLDENGKVMEDCVTEPLR